MVSIYVIDWIIMAVIIVGSAILAIESREIVVALFFFDIFAIAIGGMFLLFNAGFVAMFQLAVYAGAVAVIALFAVMLTRRQKASGEEEISRSSIKSKIASIILVLIIAAIMIVLVSLYNWEGATVVEYATAGNDQFGIFNFIIDYYELVFLGISLLLATSLIGAVALMRDRRTPLKQEEEAKTDG